MKREPIFFALCCMLLGASLGCGSTDTPVTPVTPTPDSGGAAADVTVTATNNKFDPATVTIKPGQTVRWNFTQGTHNAISGKNCTPDGTFNSGAAKPASFTFDHTFATAGSFQYYCDPHCGVGMVGTVTVAP